jgi:mRNA interferase RelE/StbE
MSFKLEFDPEAWKEWQDLETNVRDQFRAKMLERRENPEVPKDRLTGEPNCYKIKIMKPPLRLVYEVQKQRGVVKVWGIGPRADSQAYTTAFRRLRTKSY